MLTVEVGYGYIQSKYSETNPLLYHLTNPPSTYKPNVYPHRQLLAKSSSDRSERANAFKTLLFFFQVQKRNDANKTGPTNGRILLFKKPLVHSTGFILPAVC